MKHFNFETELYFAGQHKKFFCRLKIVKYSDFYCCILCSIRKDNAWVLYKLSPKMCPVVTQSFHTVLWARNRSKYCCFHFWQLPRCSAFKPARKIKSVIANALGSVTCHLLGKTASRSRQKIGLNRISWVDRYANCLLKH